MAYLEVKGIPSSLASRRRRRRQLEVEKGEIISIIGPTAQEKRPSSI
jgi:hypothetical protein